MSFSSPLLVEPHGDVLLNSLKNYDDYTYKKTPSLFVDEKIVTDVHQICNGVYSPLDRFMCVDEVKSVISDYKLRDKNSWTLPIILQTYSKNLNYFSKSDFVLLKVFTFGV